MKVVNYSPDYYDEICSWWSEYGYPILPKNVVNNGVIVFDNDKLVSACWAFYPDADICKIGFLITSPFVDNITRAKACRACTKGAINQAKEKGYKYIEAITGDNRLINTFKKYGFIEGEKNMTNLLFSIDDVDNFLV